MNSFIRARYVVVAAVILFAASGCVRRRLMIRSNPVGALVYVDNVEVGTTPCAINYTYYGTREIRLIKDGYETLTVHQPIPTPWYEIPPLDLISETMTPKEIHDDRTVSYNLTPQMVVPSENLLARAQDLRSQTHASSVDPFGAAPAGVVAPAPPFIQPVGPPIAAPGGPGVETIPPGGSSPVFLPPGQ